jgi:hypothetical protein
MLNGSFKVTNLELDQFIKVSKDTSEIHANSHYAHLNGYSDRVVHGAFFIASLLSRFPEITNQQFTAKADFFHPVIVDQMYFARLITKESPGLVFEVSKNEIVHLRITIEVTEAATNIGQSKYLEFKTLLDNGLSEVSDFVQNDVLQAIFEMSRYVGTIKPGSNAILRRVEIFKERRGKIGGPVTSSESNRNQIYRRERKFENGTVTSFSLARDFETVDSKKSWISSLVPQSTKNGEFAVVTGALGKLGFTSALLLSNLGYFVIGIIRKHDSTSNALSIDLASQDASIKFQDFDEFKSNLAMIPSDKIKIVVHCSSPKIRANFEMFDLNYFMDLNKLFSEQMEDLLSMLHKVNHLVVPSTAYLDLESVPGYFEYIEAKKLQEATAQNLKSRNQGLSLYMPRLASFKSRHSQLTAGHSDSEVRGFVLGLSEFLSNVQA